MNMIQWQEEQDAWFSSADRFDGFDRGDCKYKVIAVQPDDEFFLSKYDALLREIR
jgi:hypothetical protein